MVSITSFFLLIQTLLGKYVKLQQRQQMPKTYGNKKNRFSLVVEQILVFAWRANFARELKKLYPIFKRIT